MYNYRINDADDCHVKIKPGNSDRRIVFVGWKTKHFGEKIGKNKQPPKRRVSVMA
jgi:hypothetical protein